MGLAYVQFVASISICNGERGHGIGVVAVEITGEYYSSYFCHESNMPSNLREAAFDRKKSEYR